MHYCRRSIHPSSYCLFLVQLYKQTLQESNRYTESQIDESLNDIELYVETHREKPGYFDAVIISGKSIKSTLGKKVICAVKMGLYLDITFIRNYHNNFWRHECLTYIIDSMIIFWRLDDVLDCFDDRYEELKKTVIDYLGLTPPNTSTTGSILSVLSRKSTSR